ncbi:MAG: Gfo/Idh/MocA family oxidoreductase [Opitutaceae bacterium]|jgi:predicted dehydrogenase
MKWGVIGTGRIANAFADAIALVPGASVVAVASRSTERADSFARRIGACHKFSSAAALAPHSDVDAVFVATPHHRHEPDALATIAAGKPVLCEKPLAPDSAGARRIVTAARARGVFCMEGLWSLCQPVYREAFERIGSGEIGEIRELAGSFAIPNAFDPTNRLWDPGQCGGALLDRGVYLVALALALMDDLTPVYAASVRAATGVDSSTVFILHGSRGRRAVFTVSLESCGSNDFCVQGTAGRCVFLEPVTCPNAYWLTRQKAATTANATGGLGMGLGSLLKKLPITNRINLGLMRGARWHRGGLHHEIAEVEQCLAEGLLESRLVPLNRSIQALEILDKIAALAAG